MKFTKYIWFRSFLLEKVCYFICNHVMFSCIILESDLLLIWRHPCKLDANNRLIHHAHAPASRAHATMHVFQSGTSLEPVGQNGRDRERERERERDRERERELWQCTACNMFIKMVQGITLSLRWCVNHKKRLSHYDIVVVQVFHLIKEYLTKTREIILLMS